MATEKVLLLPERSPSSRSPGKGRPTRALLAGKRISDLGNALPYPLPRSDL